MGNSLARLSCIPTKRSIRVCCVSSPLSQPQQPVKIIHNQELANESESCKPLQGAPPPSQRATPPIPPKRSDSLPRATSFPTSISVLMNEKIHNEIQSTARARPVKRAIHNQFQGKHSACGKQQRPFNKENCILLRISPENRQFSFSKDEKRLFSGKVPDYFSFVKILCTLDELNDEEEGKRPQEKDSHAIFREIFPILCQSSGFKSFIFSTSRTLKEATRCKSFEEEFLPIRD